MIITDPKEVDIFTDMLIDEDFAKEISSWTKRRPGRSDKDIEVLQRVAHAYWHNLMLWICACRAWKSVFRCRRVTDQPKESILMWLNSGSFKAIAGRKEECHGY